jgi:predicted RNase H-like nuclease (RuvC/YqgF family)
MIQQDGKDPISLNNNQVVDIMKQQQQQLQAQAQQLQQLKQICDNLSNENLQLKKNIHEQNENIMELQKINTELIKKSLSSSS